MRHLPHYHSAVVEPALDQGKGLDSSGPRIRCPLCGWSPGKHDLWSCDRGHQWTTFDRQGVPRLPPPVGFDSVPQVWRLVATFGLVCGVTC
jgi:hypothetical protein